MACFKGVLDRNLWWSPKPIAIDEGAPFRLNNYMSLQRFKAITASLHFTNNEPPSFKEPFFNVRQMIDAYNNHMH
eukprot:11178763-Ditylum_brightwellii.AAC.1